ncbi:MAG: hypothetical protein QE263_09140 [Vampirovibrionales bacterium]|nr:hypothetical protein [Vampirovibrionales bacterium]
MSKDGDMAELIEGDNTCPLDRLAQTILEELGLKSFQKSPIEKKVAFLKIFIPRYVMGLKKQNSKKTIPPELQAQQNIAALTTLTRMTPAQLKKLSTEQFNNLEKAVEKGKSTLDAIRLSIYKVNQKSRLIYKQ